AVEIFFLQVEEFPAVNDAGVVDEDVDVAGKGLAGFPDQAADLGRIADVAGNETGVGAEMLCLQRASPLVDVGENDLRAFPHEALGDAEANAARGARDDGDLAGESRHGHTPIPRSFSAAVISSRIAGSSMVAGMLHDSRSAIFFMVPRRILPERVFG